MYSVHLLISSFRGYVFIHVCLSVSVSLLLFVSKKSQNHRQILIEFSVCKFSVSKSSARNFGTAKS